MAFKFTCIPWSTFRPLAAAEFSPPLGFSANGKRSGATATEAANPGQFLFAPSTDQTANSQQAMLDYLAVAAAQVRQPQHQHASQQVIQPSNFG